MDSDPEEICATGETETALSNVDGQNMEPALVLPEIDWNSLQIAGKDEDRMEIVSEEHMCLMLGLRDEDERAQKREEDNQMVRAMRRTVQTDDTGGAAIPVVDSIPDDIVIAYDKEDPCMDIGTMYPTMKDFREALRQYAVKREFKLGTEKSDTKRFRGFCKTRADCPWRIVAKRQADNTSMKVTILVSEHNCESSSRMRTTTASKNWVASRAESILRVSPDMGAKELQGKLEKQYNVTLLYDTVWRGREIALDKVYGKWSESFELLFRWKAEVLKRMPRSVVEIDTFEVDGTVYFHRFFCALKPCLDGFKEGCRPYLSIDSTALNGRWNGQLCSAIAVDGHTWMYPLAFGFIASETEDNWTWFMSQLKQAIGDVPLLAICTDACKGLENSVKKVFPTAEQRECFYHLMKNFQKRFHGFGRIYPAARSYREDVFTEHMAAIFSESDEILICLSETLLQCSLHRQTLETLLHLLPQRSNLQ